jgi:hypothetical protein
MWKGLVVGAGEFAPAPAKSSRAKWVIAGVLGVVAIGGGLYAAGVFGGGTASEPAKLPPQAEPPTPAPTPAPTPSPAAVAVPVPADASVADAPTDAAVADAPSDAAVPTIPIDAGSAAAPTTKVKPKKKKSVTNKGSNHP